MTNNKIMWIKALFELWRTRLALWILPFRRTVGSELESSNAAPPTGNPALVQETVNAITSASRLVPRATCLTQALAAKKMLARNGVNGVLKFGVKLDDAKFEAHAWLEVDGRAVLGIGKPPAFTEL